MTDCTKCNFMRRTDPEAFCPWHQPCPGCDVVGLAVTFRPDPYASEINGNETPVWLCSDCRRGRADDI